MSELTREQVVQILRDARCSFSDGEVLKAWLPSMTRVVELARSKLQAENAALRAEVEFVTDARIQDAKDAAANCKQFNDSLRQQLSASQLEAKRLRDTMQKIAGHPEETPPFYWWQIYARNALSSPASTEALDAYVAEKVKEETNECTALNDRLAKLLAETAVALKGEEAALTRHSWHDLPVIALAKMVEISELTRQRDLAVSAIENLVKQKGRHNTEIAYKKLVDVLAAIKESGATK